MPKAFVHGVPETSAIWGALVDELETRGIGDITLLTPPGFGAPVPQGWEPNRSNYCNWLLAELEALGGNVDLGDRTYKLASGITSEYGRYVKSLGEPRGGTHLHTELRQREMHL
jgi:hypothetical protein